mgnify:CR=1 FL=1
MLVHEAHGSNVILDRTFVWGEVEKDFAASPHKFKHRVKWGRSSTVPIETFAVTASWDPWREIMDIWASIQMPKYPDQTAMALKLPMSAIRVHYDVDVGGSYGVKRGIKHTVLVGYLAKRLGFPVRFVEDRMENMRGGDMHGPDRIFDMEAAFDDDGTIRALKIRALDDVGAHRDGVVALGEGIEELVDGDGGIAGVAFGEVVALEDAGHGVVGAEADDVIGTLVPTFAAKEKILILSSDGDFLQLQKYPNVKQYNPAQKKYVKSENPALELKEKIIRGDKGDGIPNIYSPSDCFVRDLRQKPITKGTLEKYLKEDVKNYSYDDLTNFGRNQTLIDLSFIPQDIKEKIINNYDEAKPASRQKLLNYFIEKKRKYAELLNLFNEPIEAVNNPADENCVIYYFNELHKKKHRKIYKCITDELKKLEKEKTTIYLNIIMKNIITMIN